jgi:nitroimidazol reductase NimA-like FMN-containing flavoprotein (pyridoxamine 5'-phosphate oxidase superfamily)
MTTLPPTERTTVKRLPKRGAYDRESIYGILDEGLLCHVGFIIDGAPRVIPTGYVRVEDDLYIHGSPASAMLAAAGRSSDICVEVTLIDGLVLARSAFHHSVNYRSVVVFGKARVIESPQEKLAVLKAFTKHMIPGRWADVRKPTDSELKGTKVLCLPLAEASAKIRIGPPIDDDVDYELPMWAGVLPLSVTAGTPVPDPVLPAGLEAPKYAVDYWRPSKSEE